MNGLTDLVNDRIVYDLKFVVLGFIRNKLAKYMSKHSFKFEISGYNIVITTYYIQGDGSLHGTVFGEFHRHGSTRTLALELWTHNVLLYNRKTVQLPFMREASTSL